LHSLHLYSDCLELCLHREYTVATSSVLSKLAYIATALYTHITHLISGLYKDCYQKKICHFTYPPAPGPPTQSPCKHTVLMEQLLFVIFRILCLAFGLLDSVLHGKKILYYGLRFFFYECDSSIDREGSTSRELIQRKVLHKPRKKESSSDKEQIVRYSRQKL